MRTKQRLVDFDQLVNEVIETLLIICVCRPWHLVLRGVAFKVLRQDLFEILVQFLGTLVLRKMLLVVLDQLLNLFLQLLIRDQVLGSIVLRLELLRHVLVEADVARIVAALVHLLVASAALPQRLPVVAAAGDPVVLVAGILPLILWMHLPLNASVDVIVWSLLNDSATV